MKASAWTRDPRVVCAGLAVLVRTAVAAQAWTRNVSQTVPTLDAEYYLSWAKDVAGGDLLGRHGTVAGGPFLLNPLYAYVISPLVGAAGRVAPVLAFQAALAGATAWLAASAARRHASSAAAAWTAGLLVALSASLTHLDGYVSVSGLAAFLVAGTCWSSAPVGRADERGHGPLAAGVWLGLSTLARPVALFAVPFMALLFARRAASGGRARAAGLVLAPVLACAALSFARNVAVSGEPVVYTAANGQNLYVGNAAAARRARQMFTDELRFTPREMHVDAKYRVGFETGGREPTRAEISSWFASRARDEALRDPLAAVGWCAEKLRWFFSPTEPASSADFDYDRRFVPLLSAAVASTWLVLALAAAGVVVAGRRELLLGPGALVLAHAAACTLTFPLEHYRSPCVPAAAVLAGCAVAAAWNGLRAGSTRPAALALVVAGVVATIGALSPQPETQQATALANSSAAAAARGDLAAAERDSRAALALDPESLGAAEALSYGLRAAGRAADARPWAEKLAARRPWHPLYRKIVAWLDLHDGRKEAALTAMDELVATFPWSAEVLGWRGELRCAAGDRAGATDDLRGSLERGGAPEEWALKECGLR